MIYPYFYEEVMQRIKTVTNAKTQMELAALFGIRQSSISEAKRRNSIPSDWYMKLFEKLGVNPDWVKKGVGPVYLRSEAGYGAYESKKEAEDSEGNGLIRNILVPVYGTRYIDDQTLPPTLVPAGKITLPLAYAKLGVIVLHIEGDTFAPTIRKGAYVGIDTNAVHPVSGEIFAVLMPYEGVTLKRIFFDGVQVRFLLRVENPAYPEQVLTPEECKKRLFGRLNWILQAL